VQDLITKRTTVARGRARNKHLALLSGLLYCEVCTTRMVYSYAAKNDREYPYYLCLNAQRQGWATCPAKSLPASAIEESVVAKIRDAQRGVFDSLEWNQLDRTQQIEVIQSIVERIGYDGAARQISIRFHLPPITATGQEAQA
jgi:recombinase-like zinc beta ribbon protein